MRACWARQVLKRGQDYNGIGFGHPVVQAQVRRCAKPSRLLACEMVHTCAPYFVTLVAGKISGTVRCTTASTSIKRCLLLTISHRSSFCLRSKISYKHNDGAMRSVAERRMNLSHRKAHHQVSYRAVRPRREVRFIGQLSPGHHVQRQRFRARFGQAVGIYLGSTPSARETKHGARRISVVVDTEC